MKKMIIFLLMLILTSGIAFAGGDQNQGTTGTGTTNTGSTGQGNTAQPQTGR
ncbi:MAG: hypothetical protein JW943_00450 [Deltaproteobacteria bacterium]|nr:hypothetical protein [Deltaproteobacteria bacterium]